MLKKADGSGKCNIDSENKRGLATHIEKVLNLDFGFDPTVLDEVEQRPIWDGTNDEHENLDTRPTKHELRQTLRRLAPGKETGDSVVFAERLKVPSRVAEEEEEEESSGDISNSDAHQLENALLSCVTQFWDTQENAIKNGSN